MKSNQIAVLFLIALLGRPGGVEGKPLARTQIAPAHPDQFAGRPTYGSLKKTDFFTFFHLTEDHREPLSGGGTRVYVRQTGQFSKLVEMTLDLDRGQQATAASLGLARSFVGDAHHVSPFAKDIAKSFIGTMVSEVDRQQAEYFVQAIWELRGDQDQVFPPPAVTPPPPPDVRHVLAVYLGNEPRFQVSMTATRLLMENVDVKERELQISLNLSDPSPTPRQDPGAAAIPGRVHGGDCSETAKISMMFAGIRSICVINKQMASARDLASKAAMIVEPEQVLMLADFLIGFERSWGGANLLVYDGRSGHAIDLERRVLETDTYGYGESSWHGRSFLQYENNRAGVSATLWNAEEPEGLWVVKRSELLRVAYAVVVPEDSLKEYAQFFQLLAGDAAVALQHFRTLRQKKPKDYATSEQRFALLGRALLLGGRTSLARVLADIRVDLYPESAQAAADLGDIMVAQGDREGPKSQYDRALKLALLDAALPEPQREALRKRVAAATRSLLAASASESSPKP